MSTCQALQLKMNTNHFTVATTSRCSLLPSRPIQEYLHAKFHLNRFSRLSTKSFMVLSHTHTHTHISSQQVEHQIIHGALSHTHTHTHISSQQVEHQIIHGALSHTHTHTHTFHLNRLSTKSFMVLSHTHTHTHISSQQVEHQIIHGALSHTHTHTHFISTG